MTGKIERQRQIKIGDVYMMNFCGSGTEQQGWRPGLVLQNNVGNMFSPNVIVIPFTSQLKKLNQPTHVYLPADETGLVRNSVALCENPERMSKTKLGDYLTTLPDEYMAKIAEAYILATAAISFIDVEALVGIWKKATQLNAA